jgi:hypothetical protein
MLKQLLLPRLPQPLKILRIFLKTPPRAGFLIYGAARHAAIFLTTIALTALP